MKLNFVINGEKQCRLCKTVKPVSAFFIAQPSGRPTSRCRLCHQQYKLGERLAKNIAGETLRATCKVINGEKYCKHCKITKPISEFKQDYKGVIKSRCLCCHDSYTEQRRIKAHLAGVHKPWRPAINAEGQVYCNYHNCYHNASEFYPAKGKTSGYTSYCKSANAAVCAKYRIPPTPEVNKVRYLESKKRALLHPESTGLSSRRIEMLSDSYIRGQIIGNSKILRGSPAVDALIPVYRELIKLKRMLRNEKHART